MIRRWKAAIRVWLVLAVRDAVRLELIAASYRPHKESVPIPSVIASKKPTNPIEIEPSYEMLRDESIQAQEKYYEPANN
jgi:hypothetical protein